MVPVVDGRNPESQLITVRECQPSFTTTALVSWEIKNTKQSQPTKKARRPENMGTTENTVDD